jgi:membrane-associated phospholipid phosphatase
LTPVVVGVVAAFILLCPVWFLVFGVWERRVRPGVAALLGLGLAQWGSHEVGKLRYQSRPFVVMHFAPLYPHPVNNSFPSSLTAFAAIAGVIGVLAWRRRGLVFVLGTLVVAMGCVYVGVHYVSDVIVGAALGVACGAVTWLVTGLPPVARALSAVDRRLPTVRSSESAGAGDLRAREVLEVPTGVS